MHMHIEKQLFCSANVSLYDTRQLNKYIKDSNKTNIQVDHTVPLPNFSQQLICMVLCLQIVVMYICYYGFILAMSDSVCWFIIFSFIMIIKSSCYCVYV